MSDKHNVKKIFLAVTATAVFGTVHAYPPHYSVGRELTEGEKKIANIFGEELDHSIIRLHAGPSKGKTIADVSDPVAISFYGHPFLSLDYSKEENALNFGSYVHEMTHILTFQKRWKGTNGHCPGGYYYTLNDDTKFEDLCSEEQGAVAEDYARRFIKSESAPSNWYASKCGKDTVRNDALLVKVMETRFPNAKKMRLSLGRGVLLPDAQDVDIKDMHCSPPPFPPGRKFPDGHPDDFKDEKDKEDKKGEDKKDACLDPHGHGFDDKERKEIKEDHKKQHDISDKEADKDSGKEGVDKQKDKDKNKKEGQDKKESGDKDNKDNKDNVFDPVVEAKEGKPTFFCDELSDAMCLIPSSDGVDSC